MEFSTAVAAFRELSMQAVTWHRWTRQDTLSIQKQTIFCRAKVYQVLGTWHALEGLFISRPAIWRVQVLGLIRHPRIHMQSGSSHRRCWDWQSLKCGAEGVSGPVFIFENWWLGHNSFTNEVAKPAAESGFGELKVLIITMLQEFVGLSQNQRVLRQCQQTRFLSLWTSQHSRCMGGLWLFSVVGTAVIVFRFGDWMWRLWGSSSTSVSSLGFPQHRIPDVFHKYKNGWVISSNGGLELALFST